jgi:hypothetical protein
MVFPGKRSQLGLAMEEDEAPMLEGEETPEQRKERFSKQRLLEEIGVTDLQEQTDVMGQVEEEYEKLCAKAQER